MLLKSLHLKNFMSHKDSYIKFTPGVNAILGPNGSGKSSIIFATQLALTGQSTRSQQSLVTYEQDTAEVELSFTYQGVNYTSIRHIGKNPKSVIKQEGKTLFTETKDFKTFLLNLFSNQIDDLIIKSSTLVAPFILSPSERKMIFDSMLGVAKYERAWQLLRKPESELEVEYSVVKRQIDELNEPTKFGNSFDERVKAIEEELTANFQRSNELLERKNKLSELVKSQSQDRNKAAEMRASLRGKNEELESLTRIHHNLVQETNDFKILDKCPTCGQDLSSEVKPSFVKRKKDENNLKINENFLKYETIKLEIAHLSEEIEELKFDEELFKELELVITLLSKVSENIRRLTAISDKLKGDAGRLTSLKFTQARLKAIRDTLAEIRTGIRKVGPFIGEQITSSLSIDASELFSVLSGVGNSLRFTSSYELNAIINGKLLNFNQLSEGEKVMAALSIRMAFINQISDLGLIFLDEPTINLDTHSRMALAENITGLGFNQLIVISHDDSFEPFSESIRLRMSPDKTTEVF